MRKYILKRLLSMIPAVFVVSVVIFLIIHLTPGDPAAVMLGDQADPEAIAALREALGLNDPLPVQYLRWLGGVLQGDLGQSLYSDESMVSMLLSHLGPTLSLTVFALAISLIVAVPLGILAARKRGALADNAISVFSMIGISMPSFLLGLLLMLVFAVTLRWLPAAGYKTLAEDGMAEHLSVTAYGEASPLEGAEALRALDLIAYQAGKPFKARGEGNAPFLSSLDVYEIVPAHLTGRKIPWRSRPKK